MLLQLSGIYLKRGVQILDNIHWGMKEGENWAILGPNGSGKTSLLKILLGYEHATAGKFMVLDKPFGSIPWEQIRKQVGLVSQSLAQGIENDQLVENVVIAGKKAVINTWDVLTEAEKEEAKRWLYLVGIEYLAERPWKVLSQGERQRVLIARALILRPKLLILDEPCAGLDPIAREGFLNFMQTTLTEDFKIPTLLITHHVEEILPMFSHILLLKNGKVTASGKKEEILQSEKLSYAFDSNVMIQPAAGRYYLNIVN